MNKKKKLKEIKEQLDKLTQQFSSLNFHIQSAEKKTRTLVDILDQNFPKLKIDNKVFPKCSG